LLILPASVTAAIKEVQADMILSVILCIAVAVYCFFNAMILAGVLALIGIIPGAGMVALTITSIILALNEHYIAAAFPVIVILFNIWVLLVSRRED
jgi:hypothetical protein